MLNANGEWHGIHWNWTAATVRRIESAPDDAALRKILNDEIKSSGLEWPEAGEIYEEFGNSVGVIREAAESRKRAAQREANRRARKEFWRTSAATAAQREKLKSIGYPYYDDPSLKNADAYRLICTHQELTELQALPPHPDLDLARYSAWSKLRCGWWDDEVMRRWFYDLAEFAEWNESQRRNLRNSAESK